MRRFTIVCLALAVCVPLVGDGVASGQIVGRVTLTFRTPDGGPWAGAAVSAYLHPFNPPQAYEPVVLGSGTTDSDGQFSFAPADHPDAVSEARKSIGRRVNVSVVASDAVQKLLTVRRLVVDLDESHTVTYLADIDVPEANILTEQEITVERKPRYIEKMGEKQRWVRLTQHHIGSGLNGRFCFLNGHDTETQIAFAAWVPGQGFTDWRASGWQLEARERRAGTCMPSEVAKAKGRKGPLHKLKLGRYEYWKWRDHGYHCGTGGCVSWDNRTWEPHHWVGAMKIDRGLGIRQRTRHRENSIRLFPNQDFWKSVETNTRFGVGLQIVGISLGAESGYSRITKIWWLGTKRCGRNYVYGGDMDPVEDEGALYSTSRRC